LKAIEPNCKWQNPLKLALRYQALLEGGKTKADIARIMGSSRARVTQVMSLLKLHPDIQVYLNNTKHDLNTELLTERRLRDIAAIQNSEDQLTAFRKLRKLILRFQFGIAKAAEVKFPVRPLP